MSFKNFRGELFPRTNLFSPGNGRDYIITDTDEVLSINGLYRPEAKVEIIDIRWNVITWRSCYVGVDEKGTYKYVDKLVFVGDETDKLILAHYGFEIFEVPEAEDRNHYFSGLHMVRKIGQK